VIQHASLAYKFYTMKKIILSFGFLMLMSALIAEPEPKQGVFGSFESLSSFVIVFRDSRSISDERFSLVVSRFSRDASGKRNSVTLNDSQYDFLSYEVVAARCYDLASLAARNIKSFQPDQAAGDNKLVSISINAHSGSIVWVMPSSALKNNPEISDLQKYLESIVDSAGLKKK